MHALHAGDGTQYLANAWVNALPLSCIPMPLIFYQTSVNPKKTERARDLAQRHKPGKLEVISSVPGTHAHTQKQRKSAQGGGAGL